MRKLMICVACVSAASGAATAQGNQGAASGQQVAQAQGRAACDARYYGYLVGKGLDEARSIQGGDYRVVPANSSRGDAKPKRMTIVYDSRSNVITEVGCG